MYIFKYFGCAHPCHYFNTELSALVGVLEEVFSVLRNMCYWVYINIYLSFKTHT